MQHLSLKPHQKKDTKLNSLSHRASWAPMVTCATWSGQGVLPLTSHVTYHTIYVLKTRCKQYCSKKINANNCCFWGWGLTLSFDQPCFQGPFPQMRGGPWERGWNLI